MKRALKRFCSKTIWRRPLLHRGSASIRDNEEGSALTELAIIAPVIVLFIMGVVDLGRILMHHLVLTQLAYEGVKQAAYSPGITTMTNCQCLFTTTNGLDALASTSCTSLSYDTSQYTNAPPYDICNTILKLYGVHKYQSDLQFQTGSVRMIFDTPYPDAPQNRWRFQVYATLDSLFTGFLWQQISIRAEAVGPDLAS